jgi:cell division protein FtsA
VEFVTGLDCRVGYPTEHLAKNEVLPKNIYEELQSPTFATGIGLLIKGIQKTEYMNAAPGAETKTEKPKYEPKTKEGGLFDRLLKKSITFIKDDINDEDFLK